MFFVTIYQPIGTSIDDFPCSFEILSNDHSFGPSYIGQYFNFNLTEVSCVLGGRLSQASDTWKVFYSGTNQIRDVVMWPNPNGGSIGDGHGRKSSNPAPGDWQTGQRIAFVDTHVLCQCPNIDNFECSFEILSNDHSFGPSFIGQYFNYNITEVECILGQDLPTTSYYQVFYSGTDEIRDVVMWSKPNGGSIGDGHGRINPYSNADPNDWQTGEMIAFYNENVTCCKSPVLPQPTQGMLYIIYLYLLLYKFRDVFLCFIK